MVACIINSNLWFYWLSGKSFISTTPTIFIWSDLHIDIVKSLPENVCLPCAFLFAMCKMSDVCQIVCHVFVCHVFLFAVCHIYDTRQRWVCRVPNIWHSENIIFKFNFEPLKKFKWRSFHLQSCVTSQDLQILYNFFYFLIKVTVNLFTKSIALWYSFKIYIWDLYDLWTILLTLCLLRKKSK